MFDFCYSWLLCDTAEFLHEQQSGSGPKQGHGGVVDEGEFEDPSDPARIVYNLLHHSVTNGSLDNHSAILVQLKVGLSFSPHLQSRRGRKVF